MSYVDRVLQPGETILGRTTLHWFIYLGAIMLFLLALIVFAVSFGVDLENRRWVQLGAALVALLGLLSAIRAWARRATTELAVTDRRVIYKTGFISRHTREMNRDKVESVDVEQSIAGRIFGFGSILVRGTGSTWEGFAMVADPLDFRSHITAG
jgi:uncharacterized membrane protein YdbT with pleckstrin-like domain